MDAATVSRQERELLDIFKTAHFVAKALKEFTDEAGDKLLRLSRRLILSWMLALHNLLLSCSGAVLSGSVVSKKFDQLQWVQLDGVNT